VHGIEEAHDPTPLIEFARMNYDVVVVDMGGVYGSWSLALARACDELLLVTTNELPALQATQRSLAYLERNRVDRMKTRIIVNRYHKEIGLNQDVIEAALHSDVYHLIPSDYESMQKALVEGKPVAVGSSVAKSISALAEKLSGKQKEEPPVKTSGLAGLFSSLLRR
jgi:pilus assembly protein CpaE